MFGYPDETLSLVFDILLESVSDTLTHKSVVSITHEQNIICSKTHLDGTVLEQTIICRQLFAGHVVVSQQ